jgi:hypothetical protein
MTSRRSFTDKAGKGVSSTCCHLHCSSLDKVPSHGRIGSLEMCTGHMMRRKLLEPRATAQRSKLGCLHLRYSSHPLCGRGGDTLVNTAQTPLLPPPPHGLSFTYALKRLLAFCVTLARRKLGSKRVLPPAPSAHIKPPSPAHFQPFSRHTFNSTAQAFVNAAAISNIVPALPHHQSIYHYHHGCLQGSRRCRARLRCCRSRSSHRQ